MLESYRGCAVLPDKPPKSKRTYRRGDILVLSNYDSIGIWSRGKMLGGIRFGDVVMLIAHDCRVNLSWDRVVLLTRFGVGTAYISLDRQTWHL